MNPFTLPAGVTVRLRTARVSIQAPDGTRLVIDRPCTFRARPTNRFARDEQRHHRRQVNFLDPPPSPPFDPLWNSQPPATP
jgi:hypothetical protein